MSLTCHPSNVRIVGFLLKYAANSYCLRRLVEDCMLLGQDTICTNDSSCGIVW